MIESIHRPVYLVSMLFFCCCVLALSGTVHSAVSPVVSTLSAITEGVATPVRVAEDQSGNIYVTDTRGGGVLKYNSAGTLLQKISTTSKNVLGVAIAKSGDILVSQGGAVAVYSSTGSYRTSFGTFGTANGITIDDAGAVFVVDSKNDNVQIFNVDYSPKSTFGTAGSANGQFKQPTGITFEKASRQVAVVDTHNGRVQFFTTNGVYQKTVGSFGAGPLKFTSPQGIAFEYSPDGTSLNRMYVVDSYQGNVQVIDAASVAFLRYIGSYGTHGGQMVTPGDVLLDPFNRLIIPNGNGTLAVFGLEGVSPVSASNGTAISFTSPSTGVSPPVLTLNTLSSVTKNSSITISGTVTSGASVSVNGALAPVDASGNWALPVSLTQQGLNNIIIKASKDGSTSTISAYITLDTVEPVVTVLSIPKTGSTTSSPIQTIFGTASDFTSASVTVTVNGNPQIVPVNDGLFTTVIELGYGSNNITVTAINASGMSSQPVSSTVTYNPLAPAVTVATPGATVIGSASYTVTGTAPLNSQVAVNTIPATLTGTQWKATIPLEPGFNPIIITASVAGNPVSSTVVSSVTYAPLLPSLAITSPAVDIATAKSSLVISGMAGNGTLITASLNGVTVPVSVTSDGVFTASLPPFSTLGTYAVTVTAMDANGKTSATTRSIVYDPTPPTMTVVDTTPSAIKVSSANGVVLARDKNGLITTPNSSNGTALLDLSGATYDAASLNIYVLSSAGISSRNGDINGDGKVDIADAMLAMQISLGIVPSPSLEQLLRGDVGPLVNHLSIPDGKIRLDDAILILQKAVGIDW